MIRPDWMSEEQWTKVLSRFVVPVADMAGDCRLVCDQQGNALAGVFFEEPEEFNHTVRCFHFFITVKFWREAPWPNVAMLLVPPVGTTVLYGIQPLNTTKRGVLRLARLLGMELVLLPEGTLIYYTYSMLPCIYKAWEDRFEDTPTCADSFHRLVEPQKQASQGSEEPR